LIQDKIISELDSIEKEYDVKIILASESGSRAWGFPSNDSDYDVRFIYVNKKDWYLTIAEKRDVIELPIDSALDINGWDLRKSLQLMRKSNSPLLEWLSSPIQYRVWQKAFERLAELSEISFLPETSFWHHLSMAKKHIERVKGDEKVKLKTYLYAIRSILCCKWIFDNLTQPPMNIFDLLAEIPGETSFNEAVSDFIEKKKEHPEHYTVRRSEFVESYINKNILELQGNVPKNPQKLDFDVFDDVFKFILAESSI
jgi:predicted nucleotidyltransferase